MVQCITWPVTADSCLHPDVVFDISLASFCLDSRCSPLRRPDDMYKAKQSVISSYCCDCANARVRGAAKHERCATDRASDKIDQGHPSHIMHFKIQILWHMSRHRLCLRVPCSSAYYQYVIDSVQILSVVSTDLLKCAQRPRNNTHTPAQHQSRSTQAWNAGPLP